MDIQKIIDQCLKLSPCDAEIRCNEPMKEHTSFKVGGNADFWISPKGGGFVSFCKSLLTLACKEKIPLFILGGGANIVVSDKGIRGIVLDTSAWKGRYTDASCNENEIIFKSGTSMDEAADTAASLSLCGLEFLAGMPGTIGGAVWMNARCYERETADALSRVEILTINKGAEIKNQEAICEYSLKKIETENKTGFGYKRSPFQEMDCLIISAAFKLEKGNKEKILSDMEKNREDRRKKGHYLFPSAGSVFKNNRDFGKHTGQIIDELGLKGLNKGGAQIAPFHGNIIINTGTATAVNIRSLADDVAEKVKKTAGFVLEPEILFIGDWS
jgi:UDP-N-acetylmuramate dehydrogenase